MEVLLFFFIDMSGLHDVVLQNLLEITQCEHRREGISSLETIEDYPLESFSLPLNILWYTKSSSDSQQRQVTEQSPIIAFR